MKKIIYLLTIIFVIFSLAACESKENQTASENSKKTVGLALPTQSLQRWSQDGSNMKEQFEKNGYNVDLEYANDDIDTQIQQIKNMIIRGCDVIIIGSIDGTKLQT